jgi:hypothetical protein
MNGAPCKLWIRGHTIFGRYAGDSNEGTTAYDHNNRPIHSLVIFVTPSNSIFAPCGRCHLDFRLSEEDIEKLHYYEMDAIENKHWYFLDSDQKELNEYGKFIELKKIRPIKASLYLNATVIKLVNKKLYRSIR